MEAYDEDQVMAFTADAMGVYALAKATADLGSAVWIARMQFDAVTHGYADARAGQLASLKQALGVTQGPTPEYKPVGPINGDWQDWFRGLVASGPQSWTPEGAAAAQAFLIGLEPQLNAAGVQLTPANAVGQRTKIGIPHGDGSFTWVRVGFGEGTWVWVAEP